jgi:Zn-finger nucleic acid-binding protein
MSALSCPKCLGHMRQYERNGVYVDQCADCRGIFLDHGELERLIDAEANWSAGAPTTGDRYRPHRQKRKKSFLEGLFDD